MRNENSSIKPFIINAVITLIFFLLQYNTVFSIKIGGANPMLMLTLCITFSMVSNELSAVIFSFVLGVITDGAAATQLCFNTITFIVISLAVSFTVHYLFNNNIRSAALLGILGSAVYYFARFAFCFPKQSLENAVGYILRYVTPSIIYTTVIAVPLYLLEKRIFSKYYAR